MVVDVNEIKKLKARIREINRYDLVDIEFVDGERDIECKELKELKEEFKFVGLNNCDFITTNFYLEGFE